MNLLLTVEKFIRSDEADEGKRRAWNLVKRSIRDERSGRSKKATHERGDECRMQARMAAAAQCQPVEAPIHSAVKLLWWQLFGS